MSWSVTCFVLEKCNDRHKWVLILIFLVSKRYTLMGSNAASVTILEKIARVDNIKYKKYLQFRHQFPSWRRSSRQWSNILIRVDMSWKMRQLWHVTCIVPPFGRSITELPTIKANSPKKNKRPSSIDSRERESNARGVYPTQDTSLMITTRVKEKD